METFFGQEFNALTEIETDLLEIKTTLPEIETALPEIETDLPEIETAFHKSRPQLPEIEIHTLTQSRFQVGLDLMQVGKQQNRRYRRMLTGTSNQSQNLV